MRGPGPYRAAHFFGIVLELLNNLQAQEGAENVILSGGCFLNSTTNGLVLEKTGFERAYVFSAPADDGNAVGAALLAYHEDHPEPKPRYLQTPYLGSTIQPGALEHLQQFGGLDIVELTHGEAAQKAAECLAEGEIIAWVQGRAEFGPRALGNRSILADPRSPNIKDEINRRISLESPFDRLRLLFWMRTVRPISSTTKKRPTWNEPYGSLKR